jgi:hypothetical protein
VKKSDVVYDLGCGDGRIVITTASSWRARRRRWILSGPSAQALNAKQAGVEDLVKFIGDVRCGHQDASCHAVPVASINLSFGPSYGAI